MTLAKARTEASRAFKTAKESVLSGKVSARSTSEGLIAVFWEILHRLAVKDKPAFIAWFEKKHTALGKELGAVKPVRMRMR